MDKAREQLINMIVGKAGWGPVSEWQGSDFRRLSQLIFDQTHVMISESTLRRFFGKSDYPHLPSQTTLNTLAVFAGYAGWRDFRSQQNQKTGKKIAIKKKAVFVISAALVLMLAAAALFRFAGSDAIVGSGYAFTSRPITRTIPNTVIFHYKAPGQTGPVYIQQSWDAQTRAYDDTHPPAYGQSAIVFVYAGQNMHISSIKQGQK